MSIGISADLQNVLQMVPPNLSYDKSSHLECGQEGNSAKGTMNALKNADSAFKNNQLGAKEANKESDRNQAHPFGGSKSSFSAYKLKDESLRLNYPKSGLLEVSQRLNMVNQTSLKMGERNAQKLSFHIEKVKLSKLDLLSDQSGTQSDSDSQPEPVSLLKRASHHRTEYA